MSDPLSNTTDATPMWPYWRDERGIIDALRLQYSEAIGVDPRLRLAMTQIEMAEAAIDQIMTESRL